MVFGNGHFIIINHYNKVGSHFSRIAQTFISFSAAERSIPYHGYDILVSAFQISGFGKTASQTDRGGSMADSEKIVPAFPGIGVSGHHIIILRIQESTLTPGQHLMCITLMGYIIYHLIRR